MRARLGTRTRIRYQTRGSFYRTIAQKDWSPPAYSHRAPRRLRYSRSNSTRERLGKVTKALLFLLDLSGKPALSQYSPRTMYSNAQWHVILHYMRVQANCTGADQRAIAEFLKSSPD